MGHSHLCQWWSNIMIKLILLTCLVGAAYAEADADAFYGYAGYGLGYGGYGYGGYGHYGLGYTYAGVPFGSSTGLDPITQGLDPVTQGVAFPYLHHHGKRSADADAFYGYAGYGGYGHYGLGYTYNGVPFGSSTGLDAITQGLDPVTQGVALPYLHHIGKRSADADAFYGYAGYPYYGHGYGHVYAGVPFGSSTGLDPITQGLDAVTQGVVVPHHHLVGKRSADADADADAFYGYAGYGGYGGYGYARYPYGYHGLGYGYHGLGYAYHGVPFGSSTGLDPITQGLDAVTQGLVYRK